MCRRPSCELEIGVNGPVGELPDSIFAVKPGVSLRHDRACSSCFAAPASSDEARRPPSCRPPSVVLGVPVRRRVAVGRLARPVVVLARCRRAGRRRSRRLKSTGAGRGAWSRLSSADDDRGDLAAGIGEREDGGEDRGQHRQPAEQQDQRPDARRSRAAPRGGAGHDHRLRAATSRPSELRRGRRSSSAQSSSIEREAVARLLRHRAPGSRRRAAADARAAARARSAAAR